MLWFEDIKPVDMLKKEAAIILKVWQSVSNQPVIDNLSLWKMIKINQILKNFIILEFFFIFTGFFLNSVENSFYVSTECCDNPVQTRTELIVSVEP